MIQSNKQQKTEQHYIPLTSQISSTKLLVVPYAIRVPVIDQKISLQGVEKYLSMNAVNEIDISTLN